MRHLAEVGYSVAFLLLLVSCAINPATGERQLSFMSEGQEIQMGREADPDIVASMGLYPDESLQLYVHDIKFHAFSWRIDELSNAWVRSSLITINQLLDV